MTFGWLLPLVVTMLAFARAALIIRGHSEPSDWLGPFNIIAALVLLIFAAVISLAAWLAYFIWRVFLG